MTQNWKREEKILGPFRKLMTRNISFKSGTGAVKMERTLESGGSNSVKKGDLSERHRSISILLRIAVIP